MYFCKHELCVQLLCSLIFLNEVHEHLPGILVWGFLHDAQTEPVKQLIPTALQAPHVGIILALGTICIF